MPIIRFRPSLKLNNKPLPTMVKDTNSMSDIISRGIRVVSGQREIITDENRLALANKRQGLEARVLPIDLIANNILQAIKDQHAYSIIRLGDAEILTLAQDTVFPTSVNVPVWGDLMAKLCHDPLLGKGDNNEVVRWRDMMYASGIDYPDLNARDRLTAAVKSANLIGIPTKNRPGRSRAHLKLVEGFQTVFLEFLGLHNMNPNSMQFGDSALHYLLYSTGWMYKILFPGDYPEICQRYSFPPNFKPEVLLVGNRADELADLMVPRGLKISGVIKPVNMSNIDNTLQAICEHSFDIALMAAGISAKILCSLTAQRMNRVAFDAGHLFDLLVDHFRHLDHQRTRIPYEWML
ncbi:MAG: hypothetical protein ACOX6E_04890 [Syntrophomonadaceae bacterium]|jgi:hypothetical protein